MKRKPIFNAEDRHLFASGYRVTQGDHEFVTYPANTSIRIWHSRTADDYEPHFHSAVEVLIPLEGEVVSCVNEETYHIRSGEVLIIPAGCTHDLHMEEGSERELLLYETNGVFSMKEFGAFRQLLSHPIYLTEGSEVRERVHGMLLELIRTYRSGSVLRNMRCYAMLLEIYAEIGEEYLRTSASVAEANALHRQMSGEDAFNRALDYLNRNYMDDVTLDSLSAYAGFSRYTMSRLFRQHTGKTFTQYLNDQRVVMAMELLSGTKMPVTQVALQCGFNSIATFNRVFRVARGCTPTQYRMIYDESQRR